ncbi:MAG: aromatic amino acid lyase [Leptospiraceae bacterium]|nr:aromatic amino acid lyase [Leptospiraceae bacterium]
MQDAYSIRCIPQILGAIKDTIKVHNETVTIELNSVTDNPILFFRKI